MRVHFDPEIFFRQEHGGISTYFAQLISEYTRRPEVGIDVAPLPRFVKSRKAIELGLSSELPVAALRGARPLTLVDLPRSSWTSSGCDVIHWTYYGRRRLPSRRGVANAITIHDMTPELYPDLFPRGNPHMYKRNHVFEADLIFCVSEATRSDLLELLPGFRGEAVVTPEGTGWPFTQPDPLEEGDVIVADFPYVLFVGSRSGYKAFGTLIEAMRIVRLELGLDIGLIAVGGGPIQDHDRETLTAASVFPDRFVHVSPDDRGLARLYRSALLLSYPSDYEGFGLPVLDAMASGCIVVTSDAPALLEVGAGYALVHPRRDGQALADLIHRVATQGDVEAEARRAVARAHALQLTWSRTAEKTAEGYIGRGQTG